MESTPASGTRASSARTTSAGPDIGALLTQVGRELQQRNGTADPLVIHDCIQTFRDCMSKLPPKRGSNAAFAILGDLSTDKDNRTMDRAPKRPNFDNKRRCVCGFNHLFQDCYYLNPNGIKLPPSWKPNDLTISRIISTIQGDNKILRMVEAKFKSLSLELPDWWIKVTTTATTTPPITIPIAANAVSNPPRAVNAANAVYEDEQQLGLNVAFAVAPQGVDDLFRYDTAATMHVCKDHDRFIMFEPCFKPILHGDSSSDIAGTGTVILEVDTMVGTQSVKLHNVAYIPGFHFNLVSASKLKQLGYYMDGINKRLVNKKGHVIAFLHPLNDIYSMENPMLYNSTMATIKLTK